MAELKITPARLKSVKTHVKTFNMVSVSENLALLRLLTDLKQVHHTENVI